MVSLGINSQIVNIPDANFKAKLLSSSPSNTVAKDLNGNYFAIDANGDGEIETTEAEQVGELVLIDNNILNYQGILFFSNVKKMEIENGSGLPVIPLDISNLNFLTDVEVRLFSIFPVFSGTPSLKNVNITITNDAPQFSNNAINAFNNTLTSLESLNSLEKVSLACSGYYDFPLTLNLSNHSNLKEVNINNIGLNKLDLSHCNLLNLINIVASSSSYYNIFPYFEELDISYSPLITNLTSYSHVKKLLASNCLSLQKIFLQKAQNLYLNNCPQLNEIEIRELGKDAATNPIEAINCPNIKTLSLGYQYPSFDATPFTNLEYLTLNTFSFFPSDPTFNEELQNLMLNNNANLKILNISNYKILNDLNINGLAKLEQIICGVGYNPMTQQLPSFSDFLQSLNIQNCPLLATLILSDHKGLKTAVIKNCPKLISFSLGSSNPTPDSLESLEIDNCTLLNNVAVSRSHLTNLKILNCPALKELYAEYNLLNSIDLTNSTASITHLFLSNNNLTSFNNALSFPNLEMLFLSGNRIENLDLSNHSKINYLEYRATSGFTPGSPINSPTFLKTVNLNGCSNIESVDLESSVLDKLFLKNGRNEFLSIINSPTLQYICCDASQISDIQSLVNQNGYTNCIVTSDCNIGPVLSTAENSLNPATIKVHPNPTKGDVTINADSKIKSVEVYDAQGRIIQKQMGINSQEAKVSIHGSTSGMYIFKITTEKEVITKKVIKN